MIGLATCEKCFMDFSRNSVRRSIDSFWGDGRYDWITGGARNLCEYCATEMLELRDDDGDLVDPSDIYYPDF